ncbi:glycosyltransferase family 4 protein [Flectobacillus roseus]|uniref:glycosyltransferase family 4 protein n=1 Tax=Flectobacillus roseus TaxID=502259 RepID=UPI0024B7F28F|nr:glycosyltransferase family 4 protein [Flectobacillus roseus]MDI9872478.1 glycosyltransferase family 4 protein [Flectobacillus roseus]
MKKVVLHDYGGYPFLFDISYQLSLKGYDVYHIYSSASGSPNGIFSESKNLCVIDLGKNLEKVQKDSFLKRFTQEYDYGKLVCNTIEKINPDIVFSANTPLLSQLRLIRLCEMKNIRIVHWLQDILSIAAEKVLSKKYKFLGSAIGYFFLQIEKRCLSEADYILAISDSFKNTIVNWGIDEKKILVFENWAQIDQIPLINRENDFSKEYDLLDSFNIIYTGTLGMKQNPELLFKIAQHYSKNSSSVKLIVVAAGAGKDYLVRKMLETPINNLICLPLQPYNRLPEVLGSADMLLATLNEDAGDYCVPSKVLTYYCSGKASFLIVPTHNLAARTTLIRKLGFASDPSEFNEILNTIDLNIKNPLELEQRGKNARTYAEENFKPKLLIEKFLGLFPDLF